MLRLSRTSKVAWSLAGLVLAGSAMAQSRILVARNDPHAPNFFTVNFPPELGGPQTADIVSTHFAIEVDEGAESASILSWYQRVNPLIIGGHSTGDITVVLEGDSHGAYSQERSEAKTLEGAFRTEETYAVHFTGDLSEFGIESPFVLPSASTGFVKYNDGDRTGKISMNWSGEGELAGFTFTYVCAVNAIFDTGVECSAVRGLRASCRKGDLRIVVKMADGSHDGESVIVEVDDGVYGGDPVSAQIVGDRAKRRLPGRTGEQTVRVLTREPDCQPAQTVDCS